jgi:hypothetical protein
MGMVNSILIAVGLFAGIWAALEFGRWLGRRHTAEPAAGIGAAESVVFAVLGLLVAFTFSSAASRFDERRRLIVEQSNAIGTAWLRVDLLPADDQTAIRQDIRAWLDAMLERSGDLPDEAQLNIRAAKLSAIQGQLWSRVIASVQRDGRSQTAILVLPPFNEWFDLTTTRLEMRQMGLPALVMPTLIFLSFAGAVLIGHDMAANKTRNWLHTLVFASSVTILLYVIMDLSSPRQGLIRIDPVDQVLVDLRQSFQGH